MDGNISYLFLPFSYRSRNQFSTLVNYFDRSEEWDLVQDEIRYMFRFVAEKMDCRDRKNCRCFHFRFRSEYRDQNGLASAEEWYTMSEHSFNGIMTRFRFQIMGLELFCFSTSICLLAFQLHFEKNEPFWVSNAQYYLKKVSRELIWQDGGPDIPVTILDLAKDIFRDCLNSFGFDFFFYANQKTERANMLTCLEVAPKEDYTEELYFLRRCYHDGFQFVEDKKAEATEIFYTSSDIIWGVSPEAAICLTAPESSRRWEFFEKIFYHNFENQYLYMYVLLLHRKYALYMFLTRIGVGMYNDLKKLEDYRNVLYEFDTDFTFSRVTEVHQYQMLYDRLEKVHALKKLYEDVREPVVSLGEVRRDSYEKKEKERDELVNNALALLAFLGIGSILRDIYQFTGAFLGLLLDEHKVKLIQVFIVIIVAIICIRTVIRLIILNIDKKNRL